MAREVQGLAAHKQYNQSVPADSVALRVQLVDRDRVGQVAPEDQSPVQ